ncbi:PREDICTED: interferon regulatory factor 7 [Thamnophis sirtalis]|uniref:Interferon regulatory factor 7 n=1 Tax=Thamnophis sirtalis TaxID=35019 RepID=A0A6I9Y4G3_9SAUR|nr:PREDICTED: interferon regulatory factor 7 [Thamnophis sirtalis]
MAGSAVPNENAADNFYQTNDDTLQWIIQQSQLNLTEMQHVSWAPTVITDSNNLIAGNAITYEQRSSCEAPQVTQNGCSPIGNGVAVEPVASDCYQEGPHWPPANPTKEISQSTIAFSHVQQNFPGANQFNQLEEAICNTSCFVDNIYLNEEPRDNGMRNNEMRNDYPLTANPEVMMEQSTFVPSATLPTDEPTINNVPSQDPLETAAFNIKVSIYYHNKIVRDEAEVNSCLLTYNQENCHQSHNAQVIQFPNPDMLTDQKRVEKTLFVLETARLLLYQKNGRIWAKRLGMCQVFHAFSKELDNRSQDPPCKLLPRNVETEIFNYEQFYQELVEFRDGQRRSSPDYTIYLCFGQRFTASKPKESKLILVKLVPNFCKNSHEFVQREGCSSLNSESLSLQISNSLFDMIEQLSTIFMQTETAY